MSARRATGESRAPRASGRSCCGVGGSPWRRCTKNCSYEVVLRSRRANRCQRSHVQRDSLPTLPANPCPDRPGKHFKASQLARPTALLSKGPLQGQGRPGMHNLRCGLPWRRPARGSGAQCDHKVGMSTSPPWNPTSPALPCRARGWRPFRDKCSCHGA